MMGQGLMPLDPTRQMIADQQLHINIFHGVTAALLVLFFLLSFDIYKKWEKKKWLLIFPGIDLLLLLNYVGYLFNYYHRSASYYCGFYQQYFHLSADVTRSLGGNPCYTFFPTLFDFYVYYANPLFSNLIISVLLVSIVAMVILLYFPKMLQRK